VRANALKLIKNVEGSLKKVSKITLELRES
jgi:hypothetical protein